MAHLTGGNLYPHETSVAVPCSSLVQPPIPLGSRARDASGNEYMYVDFDATKSKGELVAISSAWLASDVGATTVGVPLGVVMGTVASSDLSGWVQIYGVNTFVMMSVNATTVGTMRAAATSDGFSVLSRLPTTGGTNYFVRGIYANTTATTATSLTGSTDVGYGTMTLNYPFISGNWVSTTASTSGA